MWLINKGVAAPYDGDLSDYRELVLSTGKTPKSNTTKTPTDERAVSRKSAADARLALLPLKKATEQAEVKLEKLNAILDRLNEALAEPDLFETNLVRATKLSKERGALLNAIENAETSWLDAIDAYETAQRDAE